jgi:hypothetical protein
VSSYYISLRGRLTEANAYIENLSIRHDISVKEDIIIDARPATTQLGQTISANPNSIVLDSDVGVWIVKEVYEKGGAAINLDQSVRKIYSAKSVGAGQDVIILDERAALAAREMFTSCEAMSVLSQNSINIDTQQVFGASARLLITSACDFSEAKSVSASHALNIMSYARVLSEYLVGIETSESMVITGSVNASATYYRRLFGVDDDGSGPLSLEDWDGSRLTQIDYINL